MYVPVEEQAGHSFGPLFGRIRLSFKPRDSSFEGAEGFKQFVEPAVKLVEPTVVFRLRGVESAAVFRLRGAESAIGFRLLGIELAVVFRLHGIEPVIGFRLHGVEPAIGFRLHRIEPAVGFRLHGVEPIPDADLGHHTERDGQNDQGEQAYGGSEFLYLVDGSRRPVRHPLVPYLVWSAFVVRGYSGLASCIVPIPLSTR